MSQTQVTPITQDDLSQILAGKVESILTPTDETKKEEKNDPFKQPLIDTTFKWNELQTLVKDEEKDEEEIIPASNDNGTTQEEKKTVGRRVTDLVSIVNELVESGELKPFEEGGPKTNEEAKELIKLNLAETKKSTIEDIWKEKIESYSPQIQAILAYAEQGGSDVSPLISAISEVERNNNLDLETEEGQEGVITEFLKVSGWSPEDIKEEIETAKDLGKLKVKAEKFLPKLNQMNEQRIQAIMEEQSQRERQADDARNKYLSTIKNTLDKDKLGEVRLSRQDKAMIWEGLTDVRHRSWSGQPTNLFFKKLEEMQAGDKADYDHFLEIVYHTLNRTSFKDKLKEEIKTAETVDTVRKLKSQERKATSNETMFEEQPNKNTVKRQAFKNPWG